MKISMLTILLAAFAISGCANDNAPLPTENEFGPQPQLTEPSNSVLPTVALAKAIGWPNDHKPIAAEGLVVNAFARGLEHPRWLLVLPNGDILVAEANKPEGKAGFSGIKGWLGEKMMAYAGGSVPSPDKITLLRDTDGDGRADIQKPFLSGLHSPFGMALVDEHLYVANADALLRFDYQTGVDAITEPGEFIAELPGKTMNHHWTKNLIASGDGSKLYVAVGSNSNIGENGMEAEINRAAILEIDADSGDTRVFASGLRNPVGMGWEPESGQLWTVVNERDELGNQLVPDYLTAVVDGGFYGWPYSYWGDTVDTRVSPQQPELVATARAPDYALGAHTASLGLAFYDHSAIASATGAAIIGQHGSWNREPPSGYKVIAVPFVDGQPAGKPQDVLTGFLSADGEAYGRPVGVAVDANGAILVADDAGKTIWRVAADDSKR